MYDIILFSNYKKDTSRFREKDLNGVETTSRTTGSQSTSAPSAVLGRPLALPRSFQTKSSKESKALSNGEEKDKLNLKEELD